MYTTSINKVIKMCMDQDYRNLENSLRESETQREHDEYELMGEEE